MFYFSYNCGCSETDRECEQRVCVMVVHAGCFMEFGAILMKPSPSELLFARVHGVIMQLCFVGRMSVHSHLFPPKQPHHGRAWALGSEALYVCSVRSQCKDLGPRTGMQISAKPPKAGSELLPAFAGY